MKQTHVYKVCVLSMLSLALNGPHPSSVLSGLTIHKKDNPSIEYTSTKYELLKVNSNNHSGVMNRETTRLHHKQSMSLSKMNSEEITESDFYTEDLFIAKEDLNYTDKNLYKSASDYWESPSKISLVRLHEFLLMEQLMQS